MRLLLLRVQFFVEAHTLTWAGTDWVLNGEWWCRWWRSQYNMYFEQIFLLGKFNHFSVSKFTPILFIHLFVRFRHKIHSLCKDRMKKFCVLLFSPFVLITFPWFIDDNFVKCTWRIILDYLLCIWVNPITRWCDFVTEMFVSFHICGKLYHRILFGRFKNHIEW